MVKSIVEQQLGKIEEQPGGFAVCDCPGASLHTSPTRKHNCRVYYLSGPPTVFCVHTSCAAAIEDANRRLRSVIGKAAWGAFPVGKPLQKTPEQFAREHEQKEAARLAAKGGECLPRILTRFPWPAEQIFSDSPGGVADDPEHDWRLILSLFAPDDLLWIGDTRESGSVRHAPHFRTATEWQTRSECPPGPFILPAALKPLVCSRTKEDIERLPFMVVESDTLQKDEIGAVFRWLRDVVRLPLVAVVDTASRSLHGWFIRPDAETLRDLKAVLPAMQCDGAVLRDTQPVRLPGCQRPGKTERQALLYFNPGAAQ